MTWAAFLLRMYIAAFDGDHCLAQKHAYEDFYASGVCVWDPESEDGECTEYSSTVLQDLYFGCEAQKEKS